MHGQPGPPLEIGNQRGAELGVVGQAGVVGGCTHERREAKPVLGRNTETAVLGQHVLVAAKLFGVPSWPAKDLAPPSDHVVAMLGADSARKEA
jgi:hypothetical protein